MRRLTCLKICKTNNFLAILGLCAIHFEYKNVKLTAINFNGQTNAKYFMQAKLLRSCKDNAKVSSLPLLEITAKSTNFLHAKKEIPILWIELQTNKNTKGLKILHLNAKW